MTRVPKNVMKYLQEMGKQGGTTAANNMTPEEKRERAKKASQAAAVKRSQAAAERRAAKAAEKQAAEQDKAG